MTGPIERRGGRVAAGSNPALDRASTFDKTAPVEPGRASGGSTFGFYGAKPIDRGELLLQLIRMDPGDEDFFPMLSALTGTPVDECRAMAVAEGLISE